MQKVVVIGSLTTYEIARLLPTSSFQVVLYLAQTRLATLLGEGIHLKIENPDAPVDLPQRLMLWDLTKSFKTQLEKVKPDIIIIDVINERFDLIEYNGQYFNKTDQLDKSGLLKSAMPGHRILSPDESLSALSKLADQIGEFLNSVSHNVIMHKAYCAKKRMLGTLIEPFSESTISKGESLNLRFDLYHDVITRSVKSLSTVTSSPETALADGERYGGEIAYIYNQSHKQLVADKISSLEELKWVGFMNWGRTLKLKATSDISSEPSDELLTLCRLNRIEFYETQGPIPFQSTSLDIKQTLVRYAGNRYLYYTHRERPGKPLVIVFSGVTSTPGHNYMNYYKFMFDLDASVLYIPDIAGAHGCYYSMINGTHEIIDTNLAIISKVISDLAVPGDEVYLVGTSKGGTAALLHALLLGFGNVLAGEPQIKIGDYLFESKGPQFQSMIYTMTGRVDEKDRAYLNSILDRIAASGANEYSGKIEIIVGDATDYNAKHVRHFVESCHRNSIADRLAIITVPLNYHGNIHIPFTEAMYNTFGHLAKD